MGKQFRRLQEHKLLLCKQRRAQEQQAVSAEAALAKHDLILQLRKVQVSANLGS